MENKKYLDKILEHLKKGVRVEGDAFYVPYNNIQYHFYYRRSENEYLPQEHCIEDIQHIVETILV
jgi:hypothetical protein